MLALSPSRFRFFGRRRTRPVEPLPYRITGLAADYDAAAGVTTTPAKVSAWSDTTGNGNNLAQATDGNRPTYVASSDHFRGWPAIRFAKAATNIPVIVGGFGRRPQIRWNTSKPGWSGWPYTT